MRLMYILLGSLMKRREADARCKMQKERVDSGGSRIDTWDEKMRHACSGILVRRSCRVTPSACTVASAPSAPNEATGACPKQAGALGSSGGAAITEWLRTNDTSPSTGAKLESKRLIPNSAVRCLLQHVRRRHSDTRLPQSPTGAICGRPVGAKLQGA